MYIRIGIAGMWTAGVLLALATSTRSLGANPSAIPTSFEQAKEMGKAALNEVQRLKLQVPAGLPVTTEIIVPGVEVFSPQESDDLHPLQKKLNEKQAESVRLFQRALSLADDETSEQDIHFVRYFLCYSHFTGHEHEKAAELGDRVAREGPTGVASRPCAKIAIASYTRLYAAQPRGTAESRAVMDRMASLADYIVDTWPNTIDAEEAFRSTAAFLIHENRVAACLANLGKIPAGTPGHIRCKLVAGNLLWAKCLLPGQPLCELEHFENSPSVTPDEMRKQRMDKWGLTARSLLSEVFEVPDSTKAVTPTQAHAALSLAQIHMWQGKTQKAVASLEHKRIGPMMLVERDSAAVFSREFVCETYKVAIRAYESVGRQQDADRMRRKLTEISNSPDTEPHAIYQPLLAHIVERG